MREDVREDVKMSRCERRCEDEKMFYRPPLLEEPCAQTLSGKNVCFHVETIGKLSKSLTVSQALAPITELLTPQAELLLDAVAADLTGLNLT